MEVRPDVSGTAPRHQAFYHRSQASLYRQGPHNTCHARPGKYYSRVPGDRNWHIETADWNLASFFTIFRNLLAGIWGSFLRFIETGFRNWLAACREPALTQKVPAASQP